VHHLIRRTPALAGGARECGRKRAKQVNVVNLNCDVQNLTAKFYRFLSLKRLKTGRNTASQYLAPVFWYPSEMIVDAVRCAAYLV
jgi:hypothetical protein